MKSKVMGGAFSIFGLVALLAFVLDIWRIFSAEAPVAATLIPALKYWALAELAGGLAVVFLFTAPARKWTWREFFSLAWWQDEWLAPGFKVILLSAVAFWVGSILLDFGYKMFLAVN